VSPVQENLIDPDEFSRAVRALAGVETGRKRRDVLSFCRITARASRAGFRFVSGRCERAASLIRFRLKRSVPFDAESAALSYWPEPAVREEVDVLVAMAPLEVVSRYEAPFRAAGMNRAGDPSSLAAIELAPDGGLSLLAKLTGRVLTVVARQAGVPKLVRCLELPVSDLDEVAAVLAPTLVYWKTIWEAKRRNCTCAASARRRTRPSGASPRNWRWLWKRCGRPWVCRGK